MAISDSGDAGKEYVSECLIIVSDNFDGGVQKLSDGELMVKANAYAENLFGLVPVDRLQECYRRAFNDKTDDYPVSSVGIKNAWDAIQSDERAAEQKRIRDERENNPTVYCKSRQYHEGDANDGLVLVYLNGPGSPEALVPCPDCRWYAYDIRIREFRKKFLADRIKTTAELIDEVAANPFRYMKPVEIYMHLWKKVRRSEPQVIDRDVYDAPTDTIFYEDFTTEDAARLLIRLAESYTAYE